ncbi:hydroxymethylpyrimidine/phosphomethylpyrimidine kinase [Pedobacter frigoris]|uniref:hydroxymethylpyrimidine kinase n=1 Tax=Pedobacter frigoris TaxID=2571272 RepID=A0A4U1CGR0_9SPHI|nr:hydroxymethylpyrimidine/phosphomethylpyrimidine kinase [Pedobacter frigoris]TKC05925.1 hydroxymethylpyrimidine/phosphomethylpyrimidine kinase [Pedobacter frigoris]
MLRPYVISIAGFDPSAGAGVLADIKCFEQHQVYGFGICSSLTIQNDTDFIKNQWISAQQIIAQLAPLLHKFDVTVCKIGLIENVKVLHQVITYLKQHNSNMKIVLDPVLAATGGFEFHDWHNGLTQLIPALKQINLITPNYQEFRKMANVADEDVHNVASNWAKYCPVLLKGGHNVYAPGTDFLFEYSEFHTLNPTAEEVEQKHGSGCILSSSIAANLALGHSLRDACKLAKVYIEQFLNSNSTLLGYHSL